MSAGGRYRIAGDDSWLVRLLCAHMQVPDAFAYSCDMSSAKQPSILMKWRDLFRAVHEHGQSWNFVKTWTETAFEKVAVTKNEEGSWRRKLTKHEIKSMKVEQAQMWRVMAKHVKESLPTQWCRKMLGLNGVKKRPSMSIGASETEHHPEHRQDEQQEEEEDSQEQPAQAEHHPEHHEDEQHEAVAKTESAPDSDA